MVTSSTSVNVGAVVGGACGGLAFLFAIISTLILIKKRKEKRIFRHTASKEGHKPDPFLPTSALARDQIAPSPAHLLMDEKTRRPLATRNHALYHSPRQSDGESSDFRSLSAAGNTGRAPNVEARSWITDPFSLDDFGEGNSLSDVRGSVIRSNTPPAGTVNSESGYQTQWSGVKYF